MLGPRLGGRPLNPKAGSSDQASVLGGRLTSDCADVSLHTMPVWKDLLSCRSSLEQCSKSKLATLFSSSRADSRLQLWMSAMYAAVLISMVLKVQQVAVDCLNAAGKQLEKQDSRQNNTMLSMACQASSMQ